MLTCLILIPHVSRKTFSPIISGLCACPFIKDKIYSSCTVFPASIALRSFSLPTPPPPSSNPPPAALSFLSSLFLRSLSYSSPSLLLPPSRHPPSPPSLSEEIDWVIWLGASSARFFARGKERSGGDMTTCRNNNNIHNIGRVGMDGEMESVLAR